MSATAPVSIERIEPGDGSALAALFARYPHKTIQRRVQRLDIEKLQALYVSGFRRGLNAGAPHWGAFEDGEALALGGLHEDAWHAKIYGLRMGRIQPWLNTERPEAGAAMLDAIEAEALERSYEHLSVRVDGEDFPNLHLFESRGWRLIDVSMKLSRPMPYDSPAPGRPAIAGGWRIETAGAADRERLAELGGATHGATHFLNDPALARDKTQELFSRWVARCIDGLAWRIDVLRPPEGPAAGFVIWLMNEGFGRAAGRRPVILDFLLLDPARRGGGLGPWFVAEALGRMSGENFDYCELRTSSHNLPAIMCYEKAGFHCCASDFVLHKTLDGGIR